MRRTLPTLIVLAVSTGLFAAMAATAADGKGKPSIPQPDFQVPAGFVVEKVAGPPLVRYPLFAAFDDRGRLFVAEGTGTNLPGEELARRRLGRILVLEDTDGDGRFDTSKVFADQLVFPQGALWHDGALYTASHPSWWRFEDTGAGQAGRREELLRGFKFNGNGCDIHGPFLGPDGRLYWTDGRHGYQVTTRDGQRLEGFASRIWRSKTDGTQVERLCGGGFDNPIEIAFTPEGEAIGTMDQGTGDALLHYVEGAVYPMEHPCLQEFVMTGPLLGAIRQYTSELPPAVCGLTRYRSTHLGRAYQDTYFGTHYLLHRIVQYTLVREGSSYRAIEKEFLTSSNHDVRITDVLEDADGSLLFIDMGSWFTYGFLGNPLPKPDALGAVYRIRRSDAPAIADPWGKSLRLAQRSVGELLSLLDDPRPKVRDQAILYLGKRGNEAVAPLAQVLRAPSLRSVEARRNAIWALCRIGTESAHAALCLGLRDPDMSVRLAATHAVGVERVQLAASFLTTLVRSAEPALRRKAAEALGRIGRPETVPALVDGLRRAGDRFLQHALIYALIRINDRQATLPALNDSDPHVRRAALTALDQMQDGKLTRPLVAPLLDTEDAELQHAVLGVLAKHPGWSDEALGLLRRWLESSALSAHQEQILSAALLSLCANKNIQELVADKLADSRLPGATRVLLLRMMAQCRLETLPAGWQDSLGQALAKGDVAILREALATVKARNLSRFDGRLAELSRQQQTPADLRIAILEHLAERRQQLDDDAFHLLVAHLSEQTEPLQRMAAARTLGASTLSRGQLLHLAQRLPSASAIDIRLLLPAFATRADVETGKALVRALHGAPAAEALNLDEVNKALKNYAPQVRALAQPYLDRLAARQQKQAAYLSALKLDLAPLRGDPDAGLNVFFSTRVGCYGCHRIIGKGGNVGPDLSRIGRLRSQAELLESIVFPSLTIAPEYRTYQVATRNGRVVTGLIVRETAESLTLRTAQLAETRIARKDVDELLPCNVSLMPEGLEKTMTRQELRDLLEFLGKQK